MGAITLKLGAVDLLFENNLLFAFLMINTVQQPIPLQPSQISSSYSANSLHSLHSTVGHHQQQLHHPISSSAASQSNFHSTQQQHTQSSVHQQPQIQPRLPAQPIHGPAFHMHPHQQALMAQQPQSLQKLAHINEQTWIHLGILMF